MATYSMQNLISLTVVNLHGRLPLCGYLPTVLDIKLEATSNNSSLLNAKWNVPHCLRYASGEVKSKGQKIWFFPYPSLKSEGEFFP